MWSLVLIIIEITDLLFMKDAREHIPNIDIYPIDKNSLPPITSQTCKWGQMFAAKMNYYPSSWETVVARLVVYYSKEKKTRKKELFLQLYFKSFSCENELVLKWKS